MSYPYIAYWSWWQHYEYGRDPKWYAKKPQIYFASKKGGTWKSTLVWTSEVEEDNDFGPPDSLAIANDGTHFLLVASWFVAGLEGQVFESLDEGATWVTDGASNYYHAERMYRWNGQWVMLGGYSVCQSTDGTTWEVRQLPFACRYNNAYMMDSDGNIHICTDDGDGILYALSKDLGLTWATQYVIEYGEDFVDGYPFVTASDGHVIVGCSFEERGGTAYGLYLSFSHDGGQTWRKDDRTRHALQGDGTDAIGYHPSAVGFIANGEDIDLCISVDGSIEGYTNPYRHWAYRCPDWREPITDKHQEYTLTRATIGRGHEGVAASVDWDTGLSVFIESYPYGDPFDMSSQGRHNLYADTDMRSWMTWDTIQQREPEPVYSLFPHSSDSPVHRGPFARQCPPPQFYMQTANPGYSFWW